jgi:flavorubredoxin
MHARPPHRHHAPQVIAPDTFLIRQLIGEGEAPVDVPVNAMVIRGAEPVIVDTGGPNNRERYLDDVFSLVDPTDVRWVFLSHDDVDHYGNLQQVLEACPYATLVSNFFIGERLSVLFELPLHRTRWVNDGERFDVGDRTLVAVRPPVFDAPTTRGLFDTRTGVYWASDAFASPLLVPVDDAADIDPDFWVEGFNHFARMVSPWIALADPARFAAEVDRVRALRPTVVAGAHTPPLRGERLATALDLLADLPVLGPTVEPDQAQLDAMLAAA